MRRLALLALVAAVALSAQTSIYVGTSPSRATLGVDAKGTAVISWVQSGVKQVVTVPAKGQLFHATTART